jgi:hypothetical protein
MNWPMGTPAWSDNQLDDLVAGALRSTVVTPAQKRDAWERLRERAAAQSMLPPVVAVHACETPAPARTRLLRRTAAICRSVIDWWAWVLLDDTRYDRALRQRHARLNMTLFDSPLRNMLGGVAT